MGVLLLLISRHGRQSTKQVQIVEKPRPNLDTMLSNLFGLKVGVITREMAEEARLGRIRGVFVIEVQDNSTAAKVGLRRGDIITSIGNLSTTDTDELAEQLETVSPGDRLRIVVYRIGNRSYIRRTVVLTAQ